MSALSDIRIAVTSPSFCKNKILRQELLQVFPKVTFNDTGRVFSETELESFFAGCHGVIVGTETISATLLSKLESVEIISKYGVGVDNLDFDGMKATGIELGWTPGVNKRSVSEMALCFMIGLERNILFSGVLLKNSQWKKDGGRLLSGRKIGLIGCGNVGADLLSLLQPFNCRLYVNDVIDVSNACRSFGAEQVDLPTLLRESEIVSLHVPLLPSTRHMVNEAFLKQMRKDAFLLNTSRGAVVDESALLAALDSGQIAGAASDVFLVEPPTNDKLTGHPRFFGTPHIGGNAEEAVLAMGRSAIAHLVKKFT